MSPDPAQEAQLLGQEATAAVGRLRQVWPWLAEARIPTPHRATTTSPRPGRRRGELPAAARLSPITTRGRIAAQLRQLLTTLPGGPGPGWLVLDPASRPLTRPCNWCDGTGHWPSRKVTCPRCQGSRTVPTGAACQVCAATGRCLCDHADAVVTRGLNLLGRLLPHLTCPAAAGQVLRVVSRCDRDARGAVGVGVDRRDIHAPCPACGRWDLYAEVSAADQTQWVIRCGQPGCGCTGPGCGCGRPLRWPGRRHLWPATEWNGPDGLAARLGVVLPGAPDTPGPHPEPDPVPDGVRP